MATKTTKKKTAKKPTKAKAKAKKATKPNPPQVVTNSADPCVDGHTYDTDGDGKEYCTSCLADRAVIEKIDKKKGQGKKLAAAKAAKEPKADRKLSAIDAAAKVLGEAKEPMNTKSMVEAMSTKGYWTSPGGKTPAATLYSAILREIQTKGETARFVKTERGLFKLNA